MKKMSTARYHAVVAGAFGVVGRRLAEVLASDPDWEVTGLSRRADFLNVIKKAGVILGVIAASVYGVQVKAQSARPIEMPLTSRMSVCDFVPWPLAEATFAEFRKRQDFLADHSAEAKLDADIFNFVKKQLAFVDALIDVKKRLRGNISTASKDIDPLSDLHNVVRRSAQIADDQIQQVEQIRSAVGSTNSAAQANAALSRIWQQESDFYRKILVGRPPGAGANVYPLSPFIGLTGIGLDLPDRDSFKANYCYSTRQDALLEKSPLNNEQMLARELLTHDGGPWQKLSGYFLVADFPLLSRNVYRFHLNETDVLESNFWTKAQLKYNAMDRSILGVEIRRHKTAWPGHRGSTLMGAKPGDLLESHDFERLRPEILAADKLR